MSSATRALVALSTAVAWREPAALAFAVDRAAAEAPAAEAEEALLQSHLFVGYPAALNALAVWRRRTGRPAPAPLHEPAEATRPRGERVCRAVYGNAYDRLVENVAALQPELRAWMVDDGYGRVLGRAGLALPVRELCIVGLLAAQPAPDQLYSHLRGALRVGAGEADVEDALAEVSAIVTPERAAAAYAVWRRVQERSGKG